MANPSDKLKIALIGAGGRGAGFAHMLKDDGHPVEITAVADPLAERRQSVAKSWNLPASAQFPGWKEFFASGQKVDAVVVATMDRDHIGPALETLSRGWHLLLEKPLANSLEDCRSIAQAARKSGAMVAVCHSLRYNNRLAQVKKMVKDGLIGKVVSMDQLEQVWYPHYAHSYVRGNWRREDQSSFSLLAKSCHDVDYMSYVIDLPPTKVSSFGSLFEFKKENAPAGAAARCTECKIERDCAFSAIRIYADKDDPSGQTWLTPGLAYDTPKDKIVEHLKTSPYGRCVWASDNDVVDHQVVAMEFEGGTTATLTMQAFTGECCRVVRVQGTKGELRYNEADEFIQLTKFGKTVHEKVPVNAESGSHGGGDNRLVREWVEAMIHRDPSRILTDAVVSLRTHALTFAAEEARKAGKVIDFKAYIKEKGLSEFFG